MTTPNLPAAVLSDPAAFAEYVASMELPTDPVEDKFASAVESIRKARTPLAWLRKLTSTVSYGRDKEHTRNAKQQLAIVRNRIEGAQSKAEWITTQDLYDHCNGLVTLSVYGKFLGRKNQLTLAILDADYADDPQRAIDAMAWLASNRPELSGMPFEPSDTKGATGCLILYGHSSQRAVETFTDYCAELTRLVQENGFPGVVIEAKCLPSRGTTEADFVCGTLGKVLRSLMEDFDRIKAQTPVLTMTDLVLAMRSMATADDEQIEPAPAKPSKAGPKVRTSEKLIETWRSIECPLTRQGHAVRAVLRATGGQATADDCLDYIRQHDLYRGEWSDNEAKRIERVEYLLRRNTEAYDPSKAGSGVDVGQWDQWAKRTLPRVAALDIRRATEKGLVTERQANGFAKVRFRRTWTNRLQRQVVFAVVTHYSQRGDGGLDRRTMLDICNRLLAENGGMEIDHTVLKAITDDLIERGLIGCDGEWERHRKCYCWWLETNHPIVESERWKMRKNEQMPGQAGHDRADGPTDGQSREEEKKDSKTNQNDGDAPSPKVCRTLEAIDLAAMVQSDPDPPESPPPEPSGESRTDYKRLLGLIPSMKVRL